MKRRNLLTAGFIILLAILIGVMLFAVLGKSGSENTSSAPDASAVSSAVSAESDTVSDPAVSPESSDEVTEVTSEPEPDKVVKFLGCPDNIIHPSVYYTAIDRAAAKKGVAPKYTDLHDAEYDFDEMYKYVADAIKEADISYLNQETLPGGRSQPVNGYPMFNSPEAIIDTDMRLGFDVINLAHNHMLDAGDDSFLIHAAEAFGEAGATVLGYYPNKDALDDIPVIECNGIKIAFLTYTYETNGLRLRASAQTYIPYINRADLERQVPLAKEKADFVIVSMHWGDEDSFDLNNQQREYAELMCELGVDVVLGMHVHVIQPMEWKVNSEGHKTLVIYSLGNFVSGMVNGKNMLAGMFSLEIVKSAETGEVYMRDPLFIPIVTHYVKKPARAVKDTGYTDFMIYYLSDYTPELAAAHGCHAYGPTLVGGAFTVENLYKTVHKYIPDEFLPEGMKSTDTSA